MLELPEVFINSHMMKFFYSLIIYIRFSNFDTTNNKYDDVNVAKRLATFTSVVISEMIFAIFS